MSSPVTHSVEKRTLGKTGMQVGVLGWGAAELGFENVPDQTVGALLGVALDHGLNVVDTAECYKDSEEKLGRALRGKRAQCFLFTKCGHAPWTPPAGLLDRVGRKINRTLGRTLRDWDPRLLEVQIDQSLLRLETDYIDLMQLHSCSEEILRQGAVIDVLERARQNGKVRFIGYSGDGDAALFAVQSGRFQVLETSLNIADQEALQRTLPLALERGVGVIAKRPIANAVWKHSVQPENSYHHVYWDRIQKLQYQFLHDPNKAVETALRFTLTAPGVQAAIVGTTKPDHWRKNAESISAGPLDPMQFDSIRGRWKQVAGPDWVGQE